MNDEQQIEELDPVVVLFKVLGVLLIIGLCAAVGAGIAASYNGDIGFGALLGGLVGIMLGMVLGMDEG